MELHGQKLRQLFSLQTLLKKLLFKRSNFWFSQLSQNTWKVSVLLRKQVFEKKNITKSYALIFLEYFNKEIASFCNLPLNNNLHWHQWCV